MRTRFAAWLLRGSWVHWTLVLLGLNLAWRTLRYVQNRPMWGDEAFVAVNFALRDWAGMTLPLEHHQIVPVGFMWLVLAVSKGLGIGEMALRLAPYLAGVGGAVLVWALARRWLGGRRPRDDEADDGWFGPAAAVAATAIFAASYYPVRHAAEVKPYSMDLLAAAAMLYVAALLYESVANGRPSMGLGRRTGLWLSLAALFIISVWVSYPAAFVGGGVVMVLGWRALRQGDRRALAACAACGAALTLSFAAMYLTAVRDQSAAAPNMWLDEAWQQSYPPFDQPWRIPLWLVAKHAGNMFAYPNGGNDWGSTGTLVLVIAGAVALQRRGRGWLVVLLLSSLPLNMVAAALMKYPYGDSARVAQHVAASICLLAGAGLAALLGWWLGPRRAMVGVRGAAVVLAVVIAAHMAADAARPYKREADEAARQLVRQLHSQVGPGDVVAWWGSFNASTGEADPDGPDLRHYGGSAARVRYNLMRYGPWPIVWAPSVDELAAGSADDQPARIFLLVYHDSKLPFPQEEASAYLDAAAARLGEPVQVLDRLLGDRRERIQVYCFGDGCEPFGDDAR